MPSNTISRRISGILDHRNPAPTRYSMCALNSQQIARVDGPWSRPACTGDQFAYVRCGQPLVPAVGLGSPTTLLHASMRRLSGV